MIFDRAWALVFLILPVGWFLWERARTAGRRALWLKFAMFVAVILAVSEPRIEFKDHKVAVALLLDTSASVPDGDLAKERGILKEIEKERGSNPVQIIPFARAPRPFGVEGLDRATGTAGRATNFEAPVRQALASLPAGTIHRVVLVSDGNENEGSITRAAWQAQQAGVPVDTIALPGQQEPKLKTIAVAIPGAVFAGERFPVDLTVSSPSAVDATVELAAEGKVIGTHQVPLQAGENRVRIKTSLNAAGAIDLTGKIKAAGLGESRFENALAVRRPKVVWVSEDPPGSEGHIVDVLNANKFDFQQVKSLPAKLDDAQLVVFNNVNLEAMSPFDQQRVEQYVQSGGGALWIAGERNMYVDHKGAPEDPMARTFPAKLAPPRSPEGTCVVLIIDKSSSMEGKKIELARLAAIGVVDHLRPEDQVGVLMFDNSFQWAVPLRKAEDKTLIKRLISGITPDGGTQIAPALNEAYRGAVKVTATFKHIVLLTDGISEEGDSLTLARGALDNRITISTVGLGQDVNRAYLEKIATLAKGKAYFLNEPAGLEQILLKDVQEHTGTTAVEKAIKALVRHPSDLLEKVNVENAPALNGYVRFDLRPTADEVLEVEGIEPGRKDPLLTRWQYGLGRAAVFASDAKSRWASAWVGWSGFDRLWTNIFRDLLPHSNDSEASARYDSANQEIVVDYHLSSRAEEPKVIPDIFVLGPDNFRKAAEVVRLAPGTFRARVRVGGRQGLFRIRPLNDSRAFAEVGLYRQESELTDFGSNENLLKSVSQSTGGKFNPSVKQIFDSGGKTMDATMRLWPGLIALAILLNLIELGLRKWKGIAETLGMKRQDAQRVAA